MLDVWDAKNADLSMGDRFVPEKIKEKKNKEKRERDRE